MNTTGGDMADGRERVEQRESPAPARLEHDAAPVQSGLAGTLLTLQQSAGNRAAAHFIEQAQMALAVGATDDPLEAEADRVADHIVRSLNSSDDPPDAPAPRAITARRVARRQAMEDTIGADGGSVDAETERAITQARTGGAPIDGRIRRQMEGALGADLAAVRLHTGTASSTLSDKLNARAFTVGSDIFFNGPAPDTNSAAGQHLLAHEVAHTVQQGAVPSAQRSYDGDELVQRNPKNRNKAKKKRNRKNKANAKNKGPTKSEPTPEQGSTGILGYLGSFLPGSWSWSAPSEEEDDGGGDGYGNYELAKGEGGSSEHEKEFGDKESESTEEAKGLLDAFAPTEIEITLSDGKLDKKDTRVGDVKGSSSTKVTGGGGIKNEGKLSVEGSKGKASVEGKLLRDANGMEGEGKVEFLLGKSKEHKSGTLGWDIHGMTVEGAGQLESFGGVKGGGEVKGKYDNKTGDFSGKGKAGAMAGMGTEGTVKVKLKTGDKDLGTVEGKLGLHMGLGGELFGEIEWKGGKLTFSSGGKIVGGIGFSYSYKVELNTQSMVDIGTGWLSALWEWMSDTEGLSEEDFWL